MKTDDIRAVRRGWRAKRPRVLPTWWKQSTNASPGCRAAQRRFDLRQGFVRVEDAQASAPGRPRQPLPLPPAQQVRSYALAASTGQPRRYSKGRQCPDSVAAHHADLKGRLRGDGVVPLASALGRHADPALALHFEPGHQAVVWGTNHMQLLSSMQVQAQLQRWLSAAERG